MHSVCMKARLSFLITAAAALAACGGPDPVADGANNIEANADVDVLPPDESVATPSDELANGADTAPATGNTADGNSAY
jgi:hypothetical protein